MQTKNAWIETLKHIPVSYTHLEQEDVPTEDVSEPVASDEELTSETDSEEDLDSKDAVK